MHSEDLNTFLRPHLREFAVRMEEEMRANDHKGPDGWRHNSEASLFSWLLDEVRELHEAMARPRTAREQTRYSEDVASEAADVANIASFIADIASRKETK